MFCEKCGEKLPDNAKFCAKCGAKQGLAGEQNSVNNSINAAGNLVPGKCTNCGGQLMVDPTQQAAICPLCKSAYSVEQAINNYNAQNEPSNSHKPEEAGIFKYMTKPGGCGRVILIVFIVVGVLSYIFGTPKEKQDNKPQTTNTQQVQQGQNTGKDASKKSNNAPKKSILKQMLDNKKTSEAKSDVPREYRMALRAAESYLNTMPFSKKGLYDQLTSEYGNKFPAEAARYAVENVKTDWNKNALEAAKHYLKVMPMSNAELHDQLTSQAGDQYTKEQADYAISHLPK